MMRKVPISLTALTLVYLPLTLSAQTSQGGFETMAQPAEDQIECEAPQPPKDLAETAYIRNGYRAILRIIATEHWRETGGCNCQIAEFSWQEVVDRSEEFVTSGNPRLPFDVVKLDEMATKFEESRTAACSAD